MAVRHVSVLFHYDVIYSVAWLVSFPLVVDPTVLFSHPIQLVVVVAAIINSALFALSLLVLFYDLSLILSSCILCTIVDDIKAVVHGLSEW